MTEHEQGEESDQLPEDAPSEVAEDGAPRQRRLALIPIPRSYTLTGSAVVQVADVVSRSWLGVSPSYAYL